MTKFSPVAPAIVALALLAAPAQASTIDVSKVNTGGSVFGDENNANKWYVGTSFMVGTESRNNVGAGVFRVKGKDENGFIENFLAFCLQPLEYLTLPKLHTIENPYVGATSDALQALAANAWSLVTDSVSAGAFQMAAWEIVSETDTVQGGSDIDYQIQSGFFKITGTGGQSNLAETTAQDWLNLITADTWTGSSDGFRILTANGTQDLLTNVENPAPVPLPASGLLLLAGLAGAGAFAKRRKA